jgi:hypothetical protein
MYSLPKGAVGTLSGWVPLDNLTAQDDFEATLRGLRPVTRRKPGFETVILQKRQRAVGFSLTPEVSGAVQVAPR